MRRIELVLRPEADATIPTSDGYAVYGALLSLLDEAEPEAAEQVHDDAVGRLRNGGLDGRFGTADRRHRKMILEEERYRLNVGVVSDEDQPIFNALVQQLVLENRPLELVGTELQLESFESHQTTHRELADDTPDSPQREITFDFRSPVCIEEAGEVTTMFPHRLSVFQSLAARWQRTAPEDCQFDLERRELLAGLVEKPDLSTLDTHSVLVNRVTTGDGETRPILMQGFTGRCSYAFKDADPPLVDAVTTLARFAPYAGLGSAVARGCGCVEVTIHE
jgi:CRISPR-associated endoribonuclease Cas6